MRRTDAVRCDYLTCFNPARYRYCAEHVSLMDRPGGGGLMTLLSGMFLGAILTGMIALMVVR